MCFSVKIERDLKKLAQIFGAFPDRDAFVTLSQETKRNPKIFKVPGPDDRIYPNIFSPVIVSQGGRRNIRPMRYRIRPAGSLEEVPTKYNLYNARMEGLLKRKTWRALVGKNHCLFPFKQFYEWVNGPDGKKRLVTFFPKGKDIMWAPGLHDKWISEDNSFTFESFALITDDPPTEVLAQGHDRAPLFLKEEAIDEWLDFPFSEKKVSPIEILSKREPIIYGHTYE